MAGADVVLHTATLHKPHVETHSQQEFIDVNITGTLNLLEEAQTHKVGAFVFTSTTSAFGDALRPPPGAPAAWITEEVPDQPKNIYGVTKAAAENLCWLAHRNGGLNCLVLRTSRFFPEDDDQKTLRDAYASDNAKLNEFLYRRVDIEDVVSAHLLAAEKASEIGFRRYIISATSPFQSEDLAMLSHNAAEVVEKYIPFRETYGALGWAMFPAFDRVYVNARARRELGWAPRHEFAAVLERIAAGGSLMSDLATAVGVKGYHDVEFDDEPFPAKQVS